MFRPIVLDEDVIVIQRHNYLRTHKVTTKAGNKTPTVQLGRECVDLSAILGQEYGATFKMVRTKGQKGWGLERTEEMVDFEELFLGDEQIGGADNRDLTDENSSQKLSKDAIEAMRSEGVSGQDIVAQLIENSDTFQKKTKFSQAKFLKKKAKKYFEYLVIRQPTIRLLMQIYYKADPAKILNLRIDSLAQMLNAANVRSGGRYIVYETGCQGLVVAAALERVGEIGSVVHVFQTGCPQTQALNAMNFGEVIMGNLVTLNMYHLRSLEQGHDITRMHKDRGDSIPGTSDAEEVVKIVSDSDHMDKSTSEPGDSEATDQNTAVPESLDKIPYRQLLRERSIAAFKLMQESGGADGLLIACRQHPTNLLLYLIKYLAPSRPFVVFSPYKEPLLDAYMKIKDTGRSVLVTLSETWMRHHQVLSGRTHPEVMMSGGGGYILSGIYVDNAEPENVDGDVEVIEGCEKNGRKRNKRFRR